MILNMYSLLDVKVGSYGTPFFMAHDQQAIRAVRELAEQRDNQVARYPADFALYNMGTFDDATGLVTHGDYPKHLGMVVSFLPSKLPMPLFDQSHIMKRTTEQIERDEAQWANGAGPMQGDNAHNATT